jgi:hypothetical protein
LYFPRGSSDETKTISPDVDEMQTPDLENRVISTKSLHDCSEIVTTQFMKILDHCMRGELNSRNKLG